MNPVVASELYAVLIARIVQCLFLDDDRARRVGRSDDELLVGILHKFENATPTVDSQKHAQRRQILGARRLRKEILEVSRHRRTLIRSLRRQGRPITGVLSMEHAPASRPATTARMMEVRHRRPSTARAA